MITETDRHFNELCNTYKVSVSKTINCYCIFFLYFQKGVVTDRDFERYFIRWITNNSNISFVQFMNKETNE